MISTRYAVTSSLHPLRHYGDERALRRVLVELADELVAPGGEGADADDDLALARHHLLDLEALALELLRRRILVVNDDRQALARRHRQLARLELIVANGQLEARLVG